MQLLRGRRRVPPRPRPSALAAHRPHARRRVSVGVERRRNGDARRRRSPARARRGRARLGRRRALRAARPDRRRGSRRRRAALLAVQVLRAAPRARVRPAGSSPRAGAPTRCVLHPTSRSRGASRPARSRTSCSAGFVAAVEYLGRRRLGLRPGARAARWANVSSTGCPTAGCSTGRRRWRVACPRSR